MKAAIKSISIIGDGGWGTTLAIYLSKKGHKVCLWGAFPDYVKATAKLRENKKFLPGYKIPATVRLTADIKEAVGFGGLIVLACPSEYLASTLQKIEAEDCRRKYFLSVIKGIHPETFQRMSEIIYEHLGNVSLAVLSGPTIAKETAAGLATTAVVACENEVLAQAIQKIFHSGSFRIYTNSDIVGVEIGGSIKNVIAIACGICDGLGLGTNAKSAILTRGLAEITRLGVALGGKRETFYGLTGLGDLATTCFSPNSRNRTAGEAIGRGKNMKSALGHMVAEGVITSKAAYRLSVQLKIPMPICTEIYKILFKSKNPRRAMVDLMSRQLKAE